MSVTRGIVTLLALGMCCSAQADDGDPVCPLSEHQQSAAIDAFGKLSPIFREPRCFNCHGGMSPFLPGRGDHPEFFKFIRNRDGSEDFLSSFAACGGCHVPPGNTGTPPRWRLAPFFPDDKTWINRPGNVPKNTVQLCTQEKKLFAGDAQKFLRHMTNDDGGVPFLDVAFKGDMALNEKGRVLAGTTLPAPPGSMTRGQMLTFSKKWVEAMRGEFHAPKECGCVEMEYALRVKFHGVYEPPTLTGALRAEFATADSEAQPALIPIHFRDDGEMTGRGMLGGDSTLGIQTKPVVCEGGGKQGIEAVLSGIWPALQRTTDPQKAAGNSDTSKMEIKLDASVQTAHGAATCVDFLGRRYRGSRNKPGPGVYSLNFSLDPVVGATQTVPWLVPLPGWTGTAQVTLVKVKP